MKLDISKRAQRDAIRINARWKADGDYPELFATELLETFEHMISVSAPGTPCPTPRRPDLKRMLLEKSKAHVYFTVNSRRQVIRVFAIWDGRRERPPKL